MFSNTIYLLDVDVITSADIDLFNNKKLRNILNFNHKTSQYYYYFYSHIKSFKRCKKSKMAFFLQ